ncbi:Holliday junction resolvase RuvX [Patescibacteria group bacterium]|nr:Holliday junction resolvase RuvX [Patescibacteria group bacterium]
MNYLGIDYGERRVGFATGSDETKIASPFFILENKGRDFLLAEIKKICEQEEVEKIVVGMPLTMASGAGPQAEEVSRFVDFLKDNLTMPVETEDERFSSTMVDKLMAESRVKDRDAVAAMIILQSFFDRKK